MGDHKKVYVLDTSSIISNPEYITKLAAGNIVVVPYQVILELDNHRKSPDYTRSYSARQAINLLSQLKSKSYHDLPSALSGTEDTFHGGGKLALLVPDERDFATYRRFLTLKSHDHEGDDAILVTALSAQDQVRASGLEITLISEDAGLSLRAHAAKLATQEIRLGKLDVRELYTGYAEVFVSPDTIERFFASADPLDKKHVSFSDVRAKAESAVSRFVYNQGVVLINNQHNSDRVVTTYNPETGCLHALKHSVFLDSKNDYQFNSQRIRAKPVTKLEPRDERQLLYLEYLLDPQISLVVANGSFGTGKTLLAVASAIQHLCPDFDIPSETKKPKQYDPDFNPAKTRKYDELLILRPEFYSGPELGFMPGDKTDKLRQFLVPYDQSIKYLAKKHRESHDLDSLIQAKLVKPEATNVLRGQSIHNTLVFMDEFQNGDQNLAALFSSRIGEASKCVALGDIQQIDNRHVAAGNSALSYLMEAVRIDPAPYFAVITLTKNYRGGPSKIAQTILNMGRQVHIKEKEEDIQ